jgi:hypothetical protein
MNAGVTTGKRNLRLEGIGNGTEEYEAGALPEKPAALRFGRTVSLAPLALT